MADKLLVGEMDFGKAFWESFGCVFDGEILENAGADWG